MASKVSALPTVADLEAVIVKVVQKEMAEYDFDVSFDDADYDRVRDLVLKQIDAGKCPTPAPIDTEAVVNRIVPHVLEAVESQIKLPRLVEIKIDDREPIRLDGIVHPAFDQVVMLARGPKTANGKPRRKNILLIGPSGCGKTHLAEQVATALGLRYSFISCSAGMSEGNLTGKLLPCVPDPVKLAAFFKQFKKDGIEAQAAATLAAAMAAGFEYVISAFVDAYENGGVFLLDEIDAADSNTLLVVNSALSNGWMSVPNRPGKPIAKRHPDFVCIAGANTHGNGANRQYVGRNQLDAATLDRFRIGQVEMDYDTVAEKAFCPDKKLRERLQGYRTKMHENRIRQIISTRFLMDAYDMKGAGMSDAQIDKALFGGWTPDEISQVKAA
jgi:hypothetical protein